MKKTLLAALMGAALLSPWVAQAETSYVKLDVGQAKYSAGGSADKTGVALAFGQALDANWGYELGYVNFGKVSGSSTDPVSGDHASGSFQSQAVYATGVGTLPFNESFSAFGKLGLAILNGKVSGDYKLGSQSGSGTATETKTNLMAGVGLAYNFTKEIAATVEYNYYGKVFSDEVNLSTLTVGLKYNF